MTDETPRPTEPDPHVDPIELEPEPPAAAEPKRSGGPGDDACPNCGAPRTEREALLCLRCGYDMKTLKVVKTATGVTTEPEAETGERRRLCRAGRGGEKLPLIMAAVAGALLLIGFLMGAGGLLPGVEAVAVEGGEATIPFPDRLFGALRLALLSLVLIASGLLGLLLLAHLLDARAGDLRLAALRLLGIVVSMRLVTFLDLSNRGLEWTTETALQIALFYGLSTVLFRFTPRESATFGLSTLMCFVSIWLMSLTVSWVTMS